jgi:hypothetical protein
LAGLYRHFDGEGRLLYVGISIDVLVRQASHELRSWWFKDVRRIEITPFATRAEAAAAEVQAIRAERPRYNQQHHPNPAPRPPSAAKERKQLLQRLQAARSEDGAGGADFSARVKDVLTELAPPPKDDDQT